MFYVSLLIQKWSGKVRFQLDLMGRPRKDISVEWSLISETWRDEFGRLDERCKNISVIFRLKSWHLFL